MNGWSKRAEIFGVLVFWGAGLGGIFGALAAMLDSGLEWWVMTRGPFLESIGAGTLAIPITMFIGAFVGTLVGLLAGLVTAAYAIWARRRHSPEFVAGGIRMRIVEVIVVAAVISTAFAAHTHMQATFVQELLAFGLVPGMTALVLGWSGSEDVAQAYLRHDVRERATV
jgi:uncharacterized membrane protein